jgi:hypothetical protein
MLLVGLFLNEQKLGFKLKNSGMGLDRLVAYMQNNNSILA